MLERYKGILIFLIFILGLFLRLYEPEIVDFWGYDERRDYIRSIEAFNFNELVYLGPEIGGIETQARVPGSFFYYLCGLFFHLFSNYPAIGTIVFALLNGLSIILIYRYCKKYSNTNIALLIALIFAIMPWPVMICKKFWHSYLVVTFSFSLLMLLIDLIIEKKQKLIIPILILLAICLQIHLSSYPLVLIILILVILFKIKIKIKYYLIAVLCFVLMYLPYLIGEMNCDFQNTQQILMGILSPENRHPLDFLKAVQFTLIMPSNEISNFLGKDFLDFLNGNIILFILTVICICTITISLIVGTVKCVKKVKQYFKDRKSIYTEDKFYIIILLYIILFVLFHIIRFNIVHPRYLITIIPLQIILVGIGLNKLIIILRNNNKFKSYTSKRMIVIYISIFITFQICFNISIIRYIDINGTSSGMSKIPLKHVLETLKYLNNANNGRYIIINDTLENNIGFFTVFEREYFKKKEDNDQPLQYEFAIKGSKLYDELKLKENKTFGAIIIAKD